MGYSARPALVKQNEAMLELILQSVKQGTPLELEVPLERLYKMQWNLRNVLAATDLCQTKFTGLSDVVEVGTRKDHSKGKGYLVIRAKGKVTFRQQASALDAQLVKLEHYVGDITYIQFPPDYLVDEDALRAGVDQRGFFIRGTRVIQDDGEQWYMIERKQDKKSKSGWGVLDGYGNKKKSE